jgi:hypothetical protein
LSFFQEIANLPKIDGGKAVGKAYLFHYGNENPERRAAIDGYGHYEDERVKVNEKWLFSNAFFTMKDSPRGSRRPKIRAGRKYVGF